MPIDFAQFQPIATFVLGMLGSIVAFLVKVYWDKKKNSREEKQSRANEALTGSQSTKEIMETVKVLTDILEDTRREIRGDLRRSVAELRDLMTHRVDDIERELKSLRAWVTAHEREVDHDGRSKST